MKDNYKITINYGKYQNEYRATLYKRYSIFGFSWWWEYHYTRGSRWFVQDDVNEWLDEFQLPISCVTDLTEVEV